MDEITNLFGSTEQLWEQITQYAAKMGRGATRIVLELYYVLRSPNTPALDKTIIIAALGYQLLPNDLINRENKGLLGILDNGAALALAYNKVKARVTPEIDAQVNAILDQWFGYEQAQVVETIINPENNVDYGYNTPLIDTQSNQRKRDSFSDEEVVVD